MSHHRNCLTASPSGANASSFNGSQTRNGLAWECAREGQYWRTHGDTYEEAVANGKEALESLIISYEADEEPLPKPSVASFA